MKLKHWLYALGLIALGVLSFAAGLWFGEYRRSADEKLLASAYRVITNDSIYNQKTPRELSYTAIRGMLAIIDDPYAELIEPTAAQNFMDTFTGQTGVVGLYAEKTGEQVVISIVFPGGSAEKAGLLVGDVILAIGDMTLDRETDSSETGLMLRGSPGSTVNLKILRADQVIDYELVRQERQFVTSRMLPEGIGYIALNAFNRTASQQMKKAVEGILAQKPIGIVWDLRNNEGGDMQAAQDILSDFIEEGLLFSAKLTRDREVEFWAEGKAIAKDIPLVVLMDKTTYSAAETSAIAIAEIGRGTTIGSDSYGKGVIQATVPLVADTMLQMTVAKWVSPNGEWIQGRGVPPQIEVNDDPETEEDELLLKAIEILSTK